MPDREAAPSLVLFAVGSLRLADNPVLQAAVDHGGPVIPLFLWTPAQNDPWAPGGASRWWLHTSLHALDADLRRRGSRLVIRRGTSEVDLLRELLDQTGADYVAWDRGLTPAERGRDAALVALLQGRRVACATFNARLLLDPWSLRRAEPFKVFSAFARAVQPLLDSGEPVAAPGRLRAPSTWPTSEPLDTLRLQPIPDWAGGLRTTWQPGEAAAQRAVRLFFDSVGVADKADSAFARYATGRDLPAADDTSRLSPYLHFGELSVGQVWRTLDQSAALVGNQHSARTFRSELTWREFAHYLLVHFPGSPNESLDTSFASIPWRTHPAHLRAWQKGRTGYPLIDAGMRQLWRTGWMHNRVRMAVASFLVKDLLMPWQIGARWFWDTLVDADLANNTLGWQWTAGSGPDAAPFIRVFNPTRQAERFDPSGDFIRRYLPELAKLPAPHILHPWEAPPLVLAEAGVNLGRTYPYPIVDHAAARQRALIAFATRHSPPVATPLAEGVIERTVR